MRTTLRLPTLREESHTGKRRNTALWSLLNAHACTYFGKKENCSIQSTAIIRFLSRVHCSSTTLCLLREYYPKWWIDWIIMMARLLIGSFIFRVTVAFLVHWTLNLYQLKRKNTAIPLHVWILVSFYIPVKRWLAYIKDPKYLRFLKNANFNVSLFFL